MANEFPLTYTAARIHFFRDKIQESRTEIYTEITKNRLMKSVYPLSSEEVQDIIFQRIVNKIEDDDPNAINNFRNSFIAATIQRDAVLSRYVKNSLEQLASWHPDIQFEEAHFLEVMAEDKKTQITQTKIVPINGYYREKTIDTILSNQWEKYVPVFERIDGTIAKPEHIEILAAKNISGIYNISSVDEIKSPEQFMYEIDSRIKRNERELRKFLDWSYGRRDIKDYPYDSMAAAIVIPDIDNKRKLNGKELYKFKSYVRSISNNFYDNNTFERNQNDYEKRGIIKLFDNKYNDDNYRKILDQMDRTIRKVEIEKRRNKNNPDYRVSKDDSEKLFQGPQLKHEIEGNNKIETLIQTRKMNEEYKGPRIGHTSFYFSDRERDRMLFLLNPATNRYTYLDPSITELPSINHLDKRLFEWFLPGFDTTNRLV
jgi:hypothetical protein